jgi:polyisoprenoid-binding protein YceI
MKTTEVATKTKWVIDPTHSEILFRVKHLMISNVKGEFRKFSGEIDGDDFTTSEIKIDIDATSIYTNEDRRDSHLRSADFFDVDNYPDLTFRGLSLEKVDDEGRWRVGRRRGKNQCRRSVYKDGGMTLAFGGPNG